VPTRRLSIDEYSELCRDADISPNYHPAFTEYYFSRLRMEPVIVGRYGRDGRLLAAFPSYLMQVFPNSAQKLLLRQFFANVEIGQPEALFPVFSKDLGVWLHRLSPTTSCLLLGKVRSFRSRSLKAIAVARERRHKKLTLRQRSFFAEGGRAFFADQVDRADFADIYVRLHSRRWGYPKERLRGVKEQITMLYDHVFGVILEYRNEPVAVQLCYKCVGPTIMYVDFVNSGVKMAEGNVLSHGSVMMLTCLRKAEQEAAALGKQLRFSFGYYYGDNTYKAVWAEPQPTFVGI
jgi:Mig-14